MVVLKWEQKLISQIIKSIVASAFILWKMKRRTDFLESMDTLRSVKNVHVASNRDISLGNFVLHVSPKLLQHVESLAGAIYGKPDYEEEAGERIEPDSEGGLRLFQVVSVRNRYKTESFNSDDGVPLRLRYQSYTQRYVSESKHCDLCGCGMKRRRRNLKCDTCGVHLCIRLKAIKRKTC